MLRIKTKSTDSFLDNEILKRHLAGSAKAMDILLTGSGPGSEFRGWIDLPLNITKEELDEIKASSAAILEHSDYIVVVGIGGSYLGSRAVIEGLSPYFDNSGIKKPEIIYAGNHLHSVYYNELLEFLKDKDFSVNVISKSGTTTEPAIAFRLLKELLEEKYGKDKLKDRIIVTTDKSKGALKKVALDYHLKTYVIPDDVGGRYSVFTPVGLIPIAAAGVDIHALVRGAADMAKLLINEKDPLKNPALYYAATRNALYETGKTIEIMIGFNPKLHFIKEWWKQLFGESEGKEGKGIFPASVDMTTDLHSMGQYIQEGKRNLFETLVYVEETHCDVVIRKEEEDLDELNYLAGKRMFEINREARHGTLIAHHNGGAPTFQIVLPRLTAETIGQLLYFFEFTCGISGYMLGVNPFDQPGVEEYKQNMFALLGKKGYEKRREELSHFIDWV